MTDLDLKDIAFYTMFVVLFFIVPWTVVKASYDERFEFDLSDLWVFNDRIDLFRVMVLIAFWAHTSSNILWTLVQRITTADWLAYAGVWVTPVIIRMVGAAFGSNNGHPAPAAPEQPTPPPPPQPGAPQ